MMQKVINPTTGRRINVDGPTFRKLPLEVQASLRSKISPIDITLTFSFIHFVTSYVREDDLISLGLVCCAYRIALNKREVWYPILQSLGFLVDDNPTDTGFMYGISGVHTWLELYSKLTNAIFCSRKGIFCMKSLLGREITRRTGYRIPFRNRNSVARLPPHELNTIIPPNAILCDKVRMNIKMVITIDYHEDDRPYLTPRHKRVTFYFPGMKIIPNYIKVFIHSITPFVIDLMIYVPGYMERITTRHHNHKSFVDVMNKYFDVEVCDVR